MKTVWKYPLEITDSQTIQMPRDAEILSVQMQGLTLTLWALVDTEADTEARRLAVVGTGTGYPISFSAMFYIDTVQDHRGFAWHVFGERREAVYL